MGLSPGQIVADKYRIERLLGEGGMGAVYVATNTVLQKEVALKVMSDDFAARGEATARFLREGVAASAVKHRAIVQVYDAGVHEDAPWLAMELLEGESLADRLRRLGPLPADALSGIATEIAGALAAAHAAGIVHRDLKPDNVFLERHRDGTTQPKLLDFGIAKVTDGPSKLTRTGAVMGTAYYLSPEQARGVPDLDGRTDVFSLGVLMFEALSGQMPFEAETLPALVAKLITEAPRELRELAPDVPEELVQIVEVALTRERDERPTAEEVVAMLEGSLSASDARRRLSLDSTRPPAMAETRRASPMSLGTDPTRLAAGPSPEPEAVDIRPSTVPAMRKTQAEGRSRGIVAVGAAVLVMAGVAVAGALTLGGDAETVTTAPEPTPEPAPAREPEPEPEPAREPPTEAAPAPPAPPVAAPTGASVLVASQPRDALVLVDGEETGEVTPAVLTLRPGQRITLRRRGYEDVERVVAEGEARLDVTLARARPERSRPTTETPMERPPAMQEVVW